MVAQFLFIAGMIYLSTQPEEVEAQTYCCCGWSSLANCPEGIGCYEETSCIGIGNTCCPGTYGCAQCGGAPSTTTTTGGGDCTGTIESCPEDEAGCTACANCCLWKFTSCLDLSPCSCDGLTEQECTDCPWCTWEGETTTSTTSTTSTTTTTTVPTEYKPSGTLISTTKSENSYITQVTPMWSSYEPANTSITIYVSANGGTDWEEVTNGIKHTFSNSGKDFKYKAVFQTSNVSRTPILYNVNFFYSSTLDETVTIRTEVDRNVYVGFFDITLIGSKTTYKDKFQKSYTLP